MCGAMDPLSVATSVCSVLKAAIKTIRKHQSQSVKRALALDATISTLPEEDESGPTGGEFG